MQTMNSHCLKWGIHFDLANKRDRVEELDKTMEDPGFWDDPEHSAKIVQESKKLKSVIERYESLESARDDILMLIEIAEEENDASVLEEVEDSLQQFEQEYESLRIETLLSGEYDKDASCRCRWNRKLRLGKYVVPYVSALCRKAWI